MKDFLFLFCIALLISACNHSESSKKSENEMDAKLLSDSIVQLILTFEQDRDTIVLNHALLLSDKVMALDSTNSHLSHNLNTRIQILELLNQKKEAFLLKERTLSKDKYNIDRLIYYGQKNRLMGQMDSSEIYFNAALMQCDKLLKDTLNTDVIIEKVEIYMYQKKKKEALRIIDQALVADPQNAILTTIKDDFDEYYKISNDLFDQY